MPIRRELKILTTELQKGDVVKEWPGGRTDLLGARVVRKEYGDVWHRVEFEEHELPRTKRWKSTDWWTVWRDVKTPEEIAEESLLSAEKRLLNSADHARTSLLGAVEAIGRRGMDSRDPSDFAKNYLQASAKYSPWNAILEMWENHNRNLNSDSDIYRMSVSEEPFGTDEWSIGHASWVWCTRKREQILKGRLEIQQRWSDPFANVWRTMLEKEEYEQATGEYSTVWHYAQKWKTAYDALKEARSALI